MDTPKVFVSSTIKDLKHVREGIRTIIHDIAFEPCLSDYGDVIFDPHNGVIQSCVNSVISSDIYLIIVSKRYGSSSSPVSHKQNSDFWKKYISVTEEEFNTAKKYNKPIYALVDKDILSDYKRFTKKRNNKKEKYESIDSINIFYLLDKIYSDTNIAHEEYEKLEATGKWLKTQWAGWFKILINNSKVIPEVNSEKTDKYKEYVDAHSAFGDLFKIIEEKLDAPSEQVIINLTLISVAMFYSKSWLLSSLPKLLQKSNAIIKINAVIVQTEHLSSLDLYDYVEDWVETSQTNISKIKKFIQHDLTKQNGKLEFKLKTYKNIPHWHGWLLDDEHLFLGRTNWSSTTTDKLALQVGQNKYRHFDNTTKGGKERIDLFKNWFNFYFSYPFEPGYNSSIIDLH